MNKSKKNFLPGSALLVLIILIASFFIISFTTVYISIVSISRESKIVETMKIEQVINSGIERFKYEVYSNNLDLSTIDCSGDLFIDQNDEFSYVINCLTENGEASFYVSGYYKDRVITKKIKPPSIEFIEIEE